MHARISYAVKILLSVAIVFVLSGLIMRYITFSDRPELDKNQFSTELSDTKDLVNKTVSAVKELPNLLIRSNQLPAPTEEVAEEIDLTAIEPVAVPLTQVSEHRISSPMPVVTAPASDQVLGTASAGTTD